MTGWLKENFGTLIVAGALLLILGAVVIGMIRGHRSGGGCSGCGGCGCGCGRR